MKFSLLAASAVALLSGEAEARTGFGKCPDVTVQTIDQNRWAGTWYEIQRDVMFPFEMGAECVTSVYKNNSSGGMDYFYRGYYWQMFFQYMGVGGKLSDCASGSPDTWSCKSVMNNIPV
jgi:lipocalin